MPGRGPGFGTGCVPAGGVAGATLLALYFVPAAYLLLQGRRKPAAAVIQPGLVPA